MSVTVQLPDELADFVTAQVADGAASNEAEFLIKAVGIYRELASRQEELQRRVGRSLRQAELGQFAALDIEATKSRLAQEWNGKGVPE